MMTKQYVLRHLTHVPSQIPIWRAIECDAAKLNIRRGKPIEGREFFRAAKKQHDWLTTNTDDITAQ